MLNLYPQRATNPNNINKICDKYILANNINEISKLLNNYDNPVI